VASITHATVATGTDAGNGEIRKAQWNEDHVLDGVAYVLAQSAVSVANTAVITEEVLATITVPANAMGPNGIIEIWSAWSNNNNANSKTFRIRVGGIGGTVIFSASNTTSISLMRPSHWMNVNSASSQRTSSSSGQGGAVGASGGALVTTSVDTTASVDIVITGQKAVSGDTLSLDLYQVTVCYGA
jgi:hypothetical protein